MSVNPCPLLRQTAYSEQYNKDDGKRIYSYLHEYVSNVATGLNFFLEDYFTDF